MVFQYTGVAVEDENSTIVGGRFRYNDISAKLFWQDGWGGEMKRLVALLPKLQSISSRRSAETDGANFHFKKGAISWRLGATYVLTVDMSCRRGFWKLNYDGVIAIDLPEEIDGWFIYMKKAKFLMGLCLFFVYLPS
jgi:hypothetical protein